MIALSSFPRRPFTHRALLFVALAASTNACSSAPSPQSGAPVNGQADAGHDDAAGGGTCTLAISSFTVPTAGSMPNSIAVGVDGNVWFTESQTRQIGRLTPTGTFTEYPLAKSDGAPDSIVAGPDGNMWFTIAGTNLIGQISTATGLISYFPNSPTRNSYSQGITKGPDGNLWYTESFTNVIGRMTPLGQVTEFTVTQASAGAMLGGITLGADGNLWFLDSTALAIGRMTPTGISTEFPIPSKAQDLMAIGAGPDGNVWYTDLVFVQGGGVTSTLGRVSPTGSITEFPLSVVQPGDQGFHIAAGIDGNLWFTEQTSNVVYRSDPSGNVTALPVSTGTTLPAGMAFAPDGSLWLTEEEGGFIAHAVIPKGC